MPTPTFGTPTDLIELLTVIEAKIVAVTAINAKFVFATLLSDVEIVKTPPANLFVTLRLGNFVGMRDIVRGGQGPAYDGTLGIQMWTRLDTDQTMRAEDFLKSASGILAQWLKLLGGLQLFAPLRVSDPTKALLMEPMRNNPGFSFPDKKPPGWGRLDSSWSIKFVYRLS